MPMPSCFGISIPIWSSVAPRIYFWRGWRGWRRWLPPTALLRKTKIRKWVKIRMRLQIQKTSFLLQGSCRVSGRKISRILHLSWTSKNIKKRKGFKSWKESKRWWIWSKWSWAEDKRNRSRTNLMSLSAMMMIARGRDSKESTTIRWLEVLPLLSDLLTRTPTIFTTTRWRLAMMVGGMPGRVGKTSGLVSKKMRRARTTTRYSRWLIQSTALKPTRKTQLTTSSTMWSLSETSNSAANSWTTSQSSSTNKMTSESNPRPTAISTSFQWHPKTVLRTFRNNRSRLII